MVEDRNKNSASKALIETINAVLVRKFQEIEAFSVTP